MAAVAYNYSMPVNDFLRNFYLRKAQFEATHGRRMTPQEISAMTEPAYKAMAGNALQRRQVESGIASTQKSLELQELSGNRGYEISKEGLALQRQLGEQSGSYQEAALALQKQNADSADRFRNDELNWRKEAEALQQSNLREAQDRTDRSARWQTIMGIPKAALELGSLGKGAYKTYKEIFPDPTKPAEVAADSGAAKMSSTSAAPTSPAAPSGAGASAEVPSMTLAGNPLSSPTGVDLALNGNYPMSGGNSLDAAISGNFPGSQSSTIAPYGQNPMGDPNMFAPSTSALSPESMQSLTGQTFDSNAFALGPNDLDSPFMGSPQDPFALGPNDLDSPFANTGTSLALEGGTPAASDSLGLSNLGGLDASGAGAGAGWAGTGAGIGTELMLSRMTNRDDRTRLSMAGYGFAGAAYGTAVMPGWGTVIGGIIGMGYGAFRGSK